MKLKKKEAFSLPRIFYSCAPAVAHTYLFEIGNFSSFLSPSKNWESSSWSKWETKLHDNKKNYRLRSLARCLNISKIQVYLGSLEFFIPAPLHTYLFEIGNFSSFLSPSKNWERERHIWWIYHYIHIMEDVCMRKKLRKNECFR